MKVLKKIVFPLFSLFLIHRSYELIAELISSDPNNFSIAETMLLSFLLALFITGIFAFAGFAYPTSRLLPMSYYKISNPVQLEFVSKILGIKYFRYILLFFYWGRKSNRIKYFDGTKKGLDNFIYQTKQSEFGHLGAFITIVIVSFVLFKHGHIYLVIILTLINILGNLYPVILQRSHRQRIEKAREIGKK